MLSFHAETDVGRRRAINEDTIYADNGLFLVCDGMGGHLAGEIASKLAAETIAGFIKGSAEDLEITWPYGFDTKLSYEANQLGTALKVANRVVFRKAASSDEYTGMGTTVAAVLVHPPRRQMTYAHVGDSRIYLVRAASMVQLTRDDTWANLEWPDNSEPVHGSPMKNVLTKALGAREDVDFDVNEQPLDDGDVVLLCSDGLTNMLPDGRLFELVSACRDDLRAACRDLVADANTEGGRDNISVILLRYGG